MDNEFLGAERFQKSGRNYKAFLARAQSSVKYPGLVLRRKSSVRGGAVIGSGIGLVIFFFLSILVTINIIPLPGLVSSAGIKNTSLILFLGAVFGIIVGAACGTLVGIGTPVPLSDPQGSLGK